METATTSVTTSAPSAVDPSGPDSGGSRPHRRRRSTRRGRLLAAAAVTSAALLVACAPAPGEGGAVGIPPAAVVDDGSVRPPADAGAGRSWRLTHSDDFNGSELDLNRWTPCFSWASSYGSCTASFNNGRERYSPEQVRLSGGAAHLVAEPDPGAGTGRYKSGLISTTNRPSNTRQSGSVYSFTYGYVEARMRVPSERGFFTAFWMLPATGAPYHYSYEIDILEALGGTDKAAHMTVHHANRSRWFSPNSWAENGDCPRFDYADGYHTYGIDWQPGQLTWFIDGRACGTFRGEVHSGPMEIILNLMVDVDWQRNVGLGLRNNNASASLDVDYLKVWQRA